MRRIHPPIKQGEVIDGWTALEGSRSGHHSKVLCRCVCGTQKTVYFDGGESWGDSPSDLCDSIDRLERAGVLRG